MNLLRTSTIAALPSASHPGAADLADWLARVATLGGSVSSGTQAAALAFLDGLYAANLRSKVHRVNLFCGDNVTTACVPVIISDGTTNYGFNSDLNGGFTSSHYTEATGLRCGTTRYLNTGVNPSLSPMTTNSMHLSVYCRDWVSENALEISVGDGSGNDAYCTIRTYGMADYFSCWSAAYQASFYDYSSGLGSFTYTRTAANLRTIYYNGASAYVDSGTDSGARSNNQWFVGAQNNAGAALAYSHKLLAGYTLGTGLNDTEAAALYTLTQAFQTTLGRNV